LSSEGFLDESKEPLRLVRVEELMRRWLAASHRSAREVPVRWIIRGGKDQLESAVRSYLSRLGDKSPRKRKQPSVWLVDLAPRICIGLFAAADSLGFGFVRGAAPHIYLEQFDAVALDHLGLSAAGCVHSNSGKQRGSVSRRRATQRRSCIRYSPGVARCVESSDQRKRTSR